MLLASILPTGAYGWHNKAVEQLELIADTEKRLELIDAFILSHPDEGEAYGLRSLFENIKRQYPQAVSDATFYLSKKSLNSGRQDFDLRVLKIRAHGLYALQKYDSALKDIILYEKFAPADREIYLIEGASRKRNGERDEAIKAFKKACALNDSQACAELIVIDCEDDHKEALVRGVADYVKGHKSIDVLRQTIACLQNEKKFALATELYRVITSCLPEDDDFRQNLIQVLLQQNREKEAFAEIDKSNHSAESKERQKIAIFFGRHDAQRTLSEAQRAAKKFPGCRDFICYQATCLIKLSRYEEALGVMNGQRRFAADPDLAALRAEAYYNVQDFKRAAENWSVANKSAPTAHQLDKEGICLALLHEYEPAVVCFDKALKIDPSRQYIIGQRAEALLHLRKYDEAMADFNAALKSSGESDVRVTINYYGRGLCYTGKGAYEAAAKDFSVVIRRDPNLARAALECRAQCLEKLGDAEGAKRDRSHAAAFDKSLEKDLF